MRTHADRTRMRALVLGLAAVLAVLLGVAAASALGHRPPTPLAPTGVSGASSSPVAGTSPVAIATTPGIPPTQSGQPAPSRPPAPTSGPVATAAPKPNRRAWTRLRSDRTGDTSWFMS